MGNSRWLDGDGLGRFRAYLRFLAEVEIDTRLRKKIDPSDIVQETLLKAIRSIDGLRGESDAQVAAWLRSILARKLANAIRDLGRDRRDYRREESLDVALERSSERLRGLFSSDSTGSQVFERNQVLVRISEALSALPEDQRKAIVLRHLQEMSLDDMSSAMDRTPAAVAGLLRRGLKSLREGLRDL
jgi:RNA polymerase sigma-70 factor (ECF subfamily)